MNMFDFQDYYKQVAANLPDNCRVCEVGVADGESVIFLLQEILKLGKGIERFVLVDNFDYGKYEHLAILTKNLIVSDLRKETLYHHCEIVPYSSLDASCKFPDNYFHHVFLDSSHDYEQTKAEVRLWYRKVVVGRILAGHDYYECDMVKQAVDEVFGDCIYIENIEDKQVYKHIDVRDKLVIQQTGNGSGLWLMKKDWRIILR